MRMLDDKSYSVLKKLYCCGSLPASSVYEMLKHTSKYSIPPEIHVLCTENKFVKRTEKDTQPDDSGGFIGGTPYFVITPAGRAYVEETRRTQSNMWVPYIITTCLAFASLVVSALSLFLD